MHPVNRNGSAPKFHASYEVRNFRSESAENVDDSQPRRVSLPCKFAQSSKSDTVCSQFVERVGRDGFAGVAFSLLGVAEGVIDARAVMNVGLRHGVEKSAGIPFRNRRSSIATAGYRIAW